MISKDEAKAALASLEKEVWREEDTNNFRILSRYGTEQRQKAALLQTRVDELEKEVKALKATAVLEAEFRQQAQALADSHIQKAETVMTRVRAMEKYDSETHLDNLVLSSAADAKLVTSVQTRDARLVRLVERYMPTGSKAVRATQDLIARGKTLNILTVHQDTWAPFLTADSFAMLGMFIKYVGRVGLNINIVGKNWETRNFDGSRRDNVMQVIDERVAAMGRYCEIDPAALNYVAGDNDDVSPS